MRFQNWPELLNNFVLSHKDKPFVWGENDCCMFAGKLIKELTGNTYIDSILGTYATEKEALKLLKQGNGVRDLATSLLGKEIKSKLAQRGDIVLFVQEKYGDTLGVCIGDKCVAPGEFGIKILSMEKALIAWRVC